MKISREAFQKYRSIYFEYFNEKGSTPGRERFARLTGLSELHSRHILFALDNIDVISGGGTAKIVGRDDDEMPTISAMRKGSPFSEAELFNLFGINPSVYLIDKLDCSSWDVSSSHAGEWSKTTNYKTAATFRKYDPGDDPEAWKAILIDTMKDFPTKKVSRVTPEPTGTGLFIHSTADAHLNMMAGEEETGEAMSFQKGVDRFKYASLDLFRKGLKIGFDRILLILGNDFWHSDQINTVHAPTTHRSTPVVTDILPFDAFKKGFQALLWLIDTASQYAPVDVVIVPGNHSEGKMTYAGFMIDMLYKDSTIVSVDSSANPFKLYEYGNSAFVVAHGHDNPNRMINTLPYRFKEAFGRTHFHEVLMAHKHKQVQYKNRYVDDDSGLVIRVLQAITGTDEWHNRQSFIGSIKGGYGMIVNPVTHIDYTFHGTIPLDGDLGEFE